MKVYLGYECHSDYCDIWKHVVVVFDDEVKALVWAESMERTELDWREYEEMEVQ